MTQDEKNLYIFDKYYLSKNIIKWQDFFNIISAFLAEDCYYYKLDIYDPKKEFKSENKLFGLFPKDKIQKKFILERMIEWINRVAEENTETGFGFYLYYSLELNEENWKFQCNDSLTETFIRCSEKEFLEFQKYLKENGLPFDLFYSEKDQVCISQFIGSRCFSPKEYEDKEKTNNFIG